MPPTRRASFSATSNTAHLWSPHGKRAKITDFGIATRGPRGAGRASHRDRHGDRHGPCSCPRSRRPALRSPRIPTSTRSAWSPTNASPPLPPFNAPEPLAIAYAHKHDPVPPLPPDVPHAVEQPGHDHARQDAGRAAGKRAGGGDRTSVVRDDQPGHVDRTPSGRTDRIPSTRMDMSATRTSELRIPGAWTGSTQQQDRYLDEVRPGSDHRQGARRLVTAGVSAALSPGSDRGFYLSSHLTSQADVPGNSTCSTSRPPAQPPARPPRARPPAHVLVW